MASALEDELLGLKLKGYVLVPNDALETKIAIYTTEIVQSILAENPQIVDSWLQNLHNEYIQKKRLCDFENDPVACFTLGVYEEFEKHFKSWQDGGIISISLPRGRTIRVSKRPLITIAIDSKTTYLVCDKCQATFVDVDEFERHRRQEESRPAQKKSTTHRDDYVAPNPISWITP